MRPRVNRVGDQSPSHFTPLPFWSLPLVTSSPPHLFTPSSCHPPPPHPDRLPLVEGGFADYRHLAGHHYHSGRPGAVMRVLTIRDPRATPTQRFVRGDPKDEAVGEPIAVLVESLPPLGCQLRDQATGGRYSGGLTRGERARLLNAEVRTISRVVVDPRWRGLGLAVRLVRHALDTATTPVTEALAAMGRVSPFFERAGMVAYHRPHHPRDARLIDALASAGFSPTQLARLDLLRAGMEALPKQRQEWIEAELRRWHPPSRSRRGAADDPVQAALEAAREGLLLNPVYYLHIRGTGDA